MADVVQPLLAQSSRLHELTENLTAQDTVSAQDLEPSELAPASTRKLAREQAHLAIKNAAVSAC